MFGNLGRIIRLSLLAALGFGAGGAVLGYVQTAEDGWTWLLGLAVMGLAVSATLGFILGGRRKAIELAVYGTVAGAIAGYFTLDADFEPWLQMAVVGLVFGIVLGVVLPSLRAGGGGPQDSRMRCGECNAMVGKDDNYCPNCGAEFK
jgi:hypothetical protein